MVSIHQLSIEDGDDIANKEADDIILDDDDVEFEQEEIDVEIDDEEDPNQKSK